MHPEKVRHSSTYHKMNSEMSSPVMEITPVQNMSEKEEIALKDKMYEGILPLSKETSHTGALFYSIFHFPLLASAAMLQKCMGSVWLYTFTFSH